MSENKSKWLNIGIGAFIILAIVLLLVLILPFGNLMMEQDEIAVISISGTVTYDSSNSTKVFTSASQIEKALDDANSNPNVKGIVLDINSKGGSGVACSEIAEKIKNSSKPVIAYIGDKGLDESYMIATSADSIVASSSSSVGGIGLSYIDSRKYSKENLTGVYNKDYLKLKKSNNDAKDREEIIIRIDNCIIYSLPSFDANGRPQLLTNSAFEVFSVNSKKGKECVKKFEKIWNESKKWD